MGICVCSLAGTAACMNCPQNPASAFKDLRQGWSQFFPATPNTQPVVPASPAPVSDTYKTVEELRTAHNALCDLVKLLREENQQRKAEQAVIMRELKWVTDQTAKLVKKETKKK